MVKNKNAMLGDPASNKTYADQFVDPFGHYIDFGYPYSPAIDTEPLPSPGRLTGKVRIPDSSGRPEWEISDSKGSR